MPSKWDEWVDLPTVKRLSKHGSAALAAIVAFAVPSLVAAILYPEGWFLGFIKALDGFLALVVLLQLGLQLLRTLWPEIQETLRPPSKSVPVSALGNSLASPAIVSIATAEQVVPTLVSSSSRVPDNE